MTASWTNSLPLHCLKIPNRRIGDISRRCSQTMWTWWIARTTRRLHYSRRALDEMAPTSWMDYLPLIAPTMKWSANLTTTFQRTAPFFYSARLSSIQGKVSMNHARNLLAAFDDNFNYVTIRDPMNLCGMCS